MRTTIDLDATVLAELKRRAKRESKSLGQLASELLAAALKQQSPGKRSAIRFHTAAMGARVDLEDKDALWRTLEDR
ncbi:MAG TPA: antitoxin [Actinomycetota bacterium]|nr:antitoxin [Actinomycetota bacterium]